MTGVGQHNDLTFAPWIKKVPGGRGRGAVVVFPHAGGAAVAYRRLAVTLAGQGIDPYLLQYPQRADRLTDLPAETIPELAADLYRAGDWKRVGPLRLFGHCMGAVVAFEFARLAERDGADVRQLWVSAGQAPSTVAAAGPMPTTDDGLRAELADLGGTDPRLLADDDFVELLLQAIRADYRAWNRYACEPGVQIDADIYAVGGRRDHRITEAQLRAWQTHTRNAFVLSLFDGGHFYLNDHTEVLGELMGADEL
jgi:surfactin synthase thioesterase subunit